MTQQVGGSNKLSSNEIWHIVFNILLFIGLIIIVYFGFNSLVSFGKNIIFVRFILSTAVVSVIFYLIYNAKNKANLYKTTICIAAANDKNFLSRLWRDNLYLNNYFADRNIARSLVFEKKMNSFSDCSSIKELLETETGYLGEQLRNLESHILEYLPWPIARDYPKETYFMLLNDLETYANFLRSGKEKLEFAICDSGMEPIHEFRKKVFEHFIKNIQKPGFPTPDDEKFNKQLIAWFEQTSKEKKGGIQ
jgi:hypothetical protein